MKSLLLLALLAGTAQADNINGAGAAGQLGLFQGDVILNAAPSLTVDQYGKLGILTAVPTKTLDVTGTLGVSGAATFGGVGTFAGNVGIGTTNPSVKTEVQTSVNSSSSTILRLFNAGSGTGVGGSLGFGIATAGVDPAYISAQYGNFGDGNNQTGLLFATGGGSANADGIGTPKMVISGGGLVGIGTTAPLSPLDVAGTASFGAAATKSTMTAAGGAWFTGSVGIGTTAPGVSLDVVGAIRSVNIAKASFDAVNGVPGAELHCADCTVPYDICVGTGTGLSQWMAVTHSGIDGAARGCGSGE